MNMRTVALGTIALCFLTLSALATYTFHDGLQYFSESSEGCVGCHEMKPAYAKWQKDPHRQAATCQDCHFSADSQEKFKTQLADAIAHSLVHATDNTKIGRAHV